MVLNNPVDCGTECTESLSNVEVTVGWTSIIGENPQCRSYMSTQDISKVVLDCHTELVGRYVHVRIPKQNAILTLCEVEVIGQKCKYLSLGRQISCIDIFMQCVYMCINTHITCLIQSLTNSSVCN